MGLNLLRMQGAPPKIVGHRGARALAPENTLASFERAWRDGADVIEFDLRLAADDQVVVIHDATLERTTNGSGHVSAFSLAELKRLDAGSWFAPSYAGEPIPTLLEVLDWGRGKIGFLLELKSDLLGRSDPQLVTGVVTAIDTAGVGDQVAAISYQPRALAQLKSMAAHIPAGPMPQRDRLLQFGVWISDRLPVLERNKSFRRLLTRPLQFTLTWGCDIVAPNIGVVSPVLVAAAHDAGMPVSCGGLTWDYPQAIRMGVDTVSADDPALVRARYL